MSLNPLQNATPKQQIPNEAPSYFSPFFEQPSVVKVPSKLSVWQPPPVEEPRRSKAPSNRPLQPRQIPTVGAQPAVSRTPSKGNSGDDGKKKLYEPKEKKSMDEIMWLGSVTGFPPPVPPPMKVEASLRSKLVRKPEDKTSQASAIAQASQKKLLEAQKTDKEKAAEKKKAEEEAAREKRLLEWATKKKEQKKKSSEGEKTAPAIATLPQPVETSLRSSAPGNVRASGRRGKVFMPVPEPIETVRRSNRPNANHRPNLPDHNSSYAPTNPILPQPIETTKRSFRPAKPAVTTKKSEEESVWMGLPQPIETVRRSNRRSPLSKDSEGSEVGKRAQVSPKHTARHSTGSPKGTMFLPQPVESTKKSNKPDTIVLPQPIEVTKRTNRPMASPVQKPDGPPTPTTFFCPSPTLPQPFESVRRSHRPISGRPLVPQPIETSRRSNRIRVPQPEMQIDANQLPQPVSVSRWTNREKAGTRHLRRTSTDKPETPGLYNTAPFVRDRERERRLVKKTWVRPIDHVSHLHEPIDSAPPSPMVSPQSSRCPSLSSSPTSSAASSTWDVASKVGKASRGGNHGRRESLDEGFAGYILGLERGLKKDGALGTAGRERERAKEESEYPFPSLTELDKKGRAEASDSSTLTGSRSESSETIRPRLTAINTDPGRLEGKHAKKEQEQNYPICHSPVHSHFKVPVWKPEPEPLSLDDGIDGRGRQGYHSARIPTDELVMSKPIGIAVNSANAQLPTPPDSLTSSASNKPLLSPAMAFAAGPQTAPPRVSYAPMSPSPGYTVASLPPARKQEHGDAAEIAKELAVGVMRYLSLGFENVGRKYDDELALFTGLPMELVRKDRKLAVKKYVERWVVENPEIESGEKKKGGLW